MKRENLLLISTCTVVLAAVNSLNAQTTLGKGGAPQITISQSAVTIDTLDRSIVPVVVETRQTSLGPSAERTESVTRARLNDGTYFDWLTSTTTKQKVSPDVTEISTEIIERNRQGRDRVAQRVTETITRTPSGEQSKTVVNARNSSGDIVPASEIVSETRRNPDGSVTAVRVEKQVDVNGSLVTREHVEETTLETRANEKIVMRKTQSFSHTEGKFAVSSEETTTFRTEGNTTRSETIIRTPGRLGLAVSGKLTTVERRAADGAVERETIEHGRSLYSIRTGESTEPLVAKRKIIEREARQPDGTIVYQRDVYRRDVNGDWVAQTFSTAQSERIGRAY